MIRHTVMFRFKEETPRGAIEALAAGLSRMPGVIPGIRRYEFGEDLGVTDGAYDFALIADFDDIDGYKVYAGHPEHLDLIRTLVMPISASTVRLQYEVA